MTDTGFRRGFGPDDFVPTWAGGGNPVYDGYPLVADSTSEGGFRVGSPFSMGLGVYGDGSDGAQVFDGTTSILGMAPSSSVYTLTRDIFLADGSIVRSGVTISTAGFRIFCSGTLTNNGTISSNGSAGRVGSTSTQAGGNRATAGNATFGGAGTNGGNATVTTGGSSSAVTISLGAVGGNGGAGANAAGSAGTVSAPTAAQGTVHSLPGALVGSQGGVAGNVANLYTPGTGGGGGGGDGTNTGGSGGGAGGQVFLAARAIAGSGAIQARGGAGGNGAVAGTNCGGGGGGGGGYIVVISGSVQFNLVSGQTVVPGQAIDALGGAKGTHTGSGSDGSAGSNGNVYLIPN